MSLEASFEGRPKSIEAEPVIPGPAFNISSLFLDLDAMLRQPECPDNLFIAKASRAESTTIWKSERSEIRKDFKKQAKEAKRLIRKKQNISKSRNVA